MLYFTPKKFQVHEVWGSNSIGKRRCQAGGSPSALCRKSCVEVWFNFSPFLHSLPPFLSPLESITLCRLSYVGRRPPVAASRLSPRTLTRVSRVRLVLSGFCVKTAACRNDKNAEFFPFSTLIQNYIEWVHAATFYHRFRAEASYYWVSKRWFFRA